MEVSRQYIALRDYIHRFSLIQMILQKLYGSEDPKGTIVQNLAKRINAIHGRIEIQMERMETRSKSTRHQRPLIGRISFAL